MIRERMKNMIDLVLNEFMLANYRILENQLGLPILTNKTGSDFWILCENYDISIDKQRELFEAYRQNVKEYPIAEKNTSVLVLRCVHRMDDDIQAWAVELENDKCYFKKYVLLYTEKAWKLLSNEILFDKKKTLSSYLIDPFVFGELKKDRVDGAYTLLYGIAHKLPFLLVEMEQSKLELAYPNIWKKPELGKVDKWLSALPDDREGQEQKIDELLNALDDEQI